MANLRIVGHDFGWCITEQHWQEGWVQRDVLHQATAAELAVHLAEGLQWDYPVVPLLSRSGRRLAPMALLAIPEPLTLPLAPRAFRV